MSAGELARAMVEGCDSMSHLDAGGALALRDDLEALEAEGWQFVAPAEEPEA